MSQSPSDWLNHPDLLTPLWDKLMHIIDHYRNCSCRTLIYGQMAWRIYIILRTKRNLKRGKKGIEMELILILKMLYMLTCLGLCDAWCSSGSRHGYAFLDTGENVGQILITRASLAWLAGWSGSVLPTVKSPLADGRGALSLPVFAQARFSLLDPAQPVRYCIIGVFRLLG